MHWSLAEETNDRAAALGERDMRRMAGMSGRRRRQFVTGRWLLRAMLSRLIPAQTAPITLVARCRKCASATHGRIEARLRGERLWLTLAHARDVVVAGVARSSIGVDIETELAHPEVLEHVVAGRAAEHDLFEHRRARVTRAWCRGEALAKAAGMDLRTSFALLRDVAARAGPIEVPLRGGWTVTDLPAPVPGYTAAVAIGGDVRAWPSSAAISRWQQ